MKFFLFLIIFLLMAAGIYLYNNPDAWNRLQGMSESVGLQGNKVIMYKWKNKDGVVQYTQQAPANGIPYEKVELRSDVNVMPLPEKLKDQFDK